jgi:hypothetical protein
MSALVESAPTPSINPAPLAKQNGADDTSNFNFTVYYDLTGVKPRSTSNPNICYYKIFHYVSTFGDGWTGAEQNPLQFNITASAGPSAIEYRGNLHLFWRDAPDGAGIYHATTSNL